MGQRWTGLFLGPSLFSFRRALALAGLCTAPEHTCESRAGGGLLRCVWIMSPRGHLPEKRGFGFVSVLCCSSLTYYLEPSYLHRFRMVPRLFLLDLKNTVENISVGIFPFVNVCTPPPTPNP